jgi:hypothetical protein
MAHNRSPMETKPLDIGVVPNQHQYVVDQLQARKGSWPSIAHKSGVARHTLAKIADGRIKDPGYSKVYALFQTLSAAGPATKPS